MNDAIANWQTNLLKQENLGRRIFWPVWMTQGVLLSMTMMRNRGSWRRTLVSGSIEWRSRWPLRPAEGVLGNQVLAWSSIQAWTPSTTQLSGSLSNQDDDGNKNPTNFHIWQWKTVFLHALHVHFSSFDILKTFSFFLRREKWLVLQFCGRYERMMTNVQLYLFISQALVPI